MSELAKNQAPVPAPSIEPSPSVLLWILFAISQTVSFAMILAAAVSFVQHDNPFAMLGGIMLLPVAIIAAYLQFMAVVKCNSTSAYICAICYLFGAGIALFALASNALEAISKKEGGSASFWLIFSAICVAIAATCGACARIYGRWAGQLDRYWQSLTPCPKCGYDMRGNIAAGVERCPECGTAIPKGQSKPNQARS